MSDNKGDMTGCSITVYGMVQGVGYRYSAVKAAALHKVSGWVRNRHDGSVEIECEGSREDIEKFIQSLTKGPSYARVTGIDKKEKPYRGIYSGFEIEY